MTIEDNANFNKIWNSIIMEARQIKLVSVTQWLQENKAKDIILYGTGICGRSALSNLRSLGFNIVAFSDSNSSKWEKNIDGLKIIPPSSISKMFNDPFIIICFNEHYKIEIPKTKILLNNFCCTRNIFYGDLRSVLDFQKLDNPLALCRAILPNEEYKYKISKVYSTLSDEVSRKTLIDVLLDRIRIFPQWELPSYQMYFPEDIFQLSDNEVFFDCGAYNGDTLQAFLARRPNFMKYFAFEPDSKNAIKFNQNLKNYPTEQQNKILLKEKAISDKCGNVFFEETGEIGGSRITESGNSVSCTTLDFEFNSDVKPTYVKMDIEGGEKQAILGGLQGIKNHKPSLAVSVYHYPNDLWEIPTMIHDNFPFYNIFLRAYLAGDIVCYAIPK